MCAPALRERPISADAARVIDRVIGREFPIAIVLTGRLERVDLPLRRQA
jgi:hypothetical protein